MPLTREQIFALADKRPIQALPTTTQLKQQRKQQKEAPTAGPDWFDMPAPEMTQELKDDLRILSLRSALDPSRHYKKGDKAVTSRFLQVGTVVSDPSAYYTERMSRKQRAAPTIVDSLLRDVDRRQYLKRKYGEIASVKIRNGRSQSRNAVKKPWKK